VLLARSFSVRPRAQAKQLGGKGSVRRVHKAAHKPSAADDKKLQSTIKRLNCNTVTAVSEVLFLKNNDTAMVFGQGVKVQANIQANTFVVTGSHTVKKQSDIPGLQSLGGGGIDPAQLAQLQKMMAQAKSGGAADADVPELVEDFEKVSEAD
jgi:nascent polypeptide-associated complex subunit beta